MDTLSHAAWGYASVRKNGKKMAWWGAVAGAAPDLLTFGPFYIWKFTTKGWEAFSHWGKHSSNIWRKGGPPLPSQILESYAIYNFSHSLIVLGLLLLLLFFLFKRLRPWLWLGIPYGLHIVMDIFTHERYLTPFLFPISDYTFEGISWGRPIIFYPNLVSLALIYFWIYKKFESKRTSHTDIPSSNK